MGENFSLGEMSLGSMIDGGRQYKTPPYQRKYSWKKPEYSKLFEDIEENVTNYEADATDGLSYYYIGTILLVKKPEESDYEIVDGQQRLVSIALLYAAIYKYIDDLNNKVKELKNEESAREELHGILQGILQERREGIKKFLLTNRGNLKVVPQEQFGDKDDFIKILNDINITNMSHKARSNHGNRIIATVYNYFYKEIRRYTGGFTANEPKYTNAKIEKEIDSVKKFLDGMRRISFVGLTAVNYENAYQLFETLNNRGKPLTAVDLIKNMIYAKLTDKTKTDKNYLIWEKLVKNLIKESRASEINADRYFRDFYNVFSITRSKYRKAISTTKSQASKINMIGIYEKIMKNLASNGVSAEELLKFLKDKSDIYNQIIYPHEINNTGNSSEQTSYSKIVECCTIVQDVKVVAVNAFLLYIFNKYETEKKFKIEEKLKIVELIAKFSVRRIVTDFPRTNTLDLLMINLIKFCERESKILSADAIEKKLIDEIKKLPKHDDFAFDNLEDLTKGFASLKADDSRVFVKTILTHLNNNNENSNGFKKIGHDFTIEHIMPQTLTDEWCRLLNGISDDNKNKTQNKKETTKTHKEWLHSIGNLTLITTAENGEISNNELSIKQQVYNKRNTWLNSVECSVNGKKISAKESKGKWNSMNIENRTELLAEELAKFYQFNSEKNFEK